MKNLVHCEYNMDTVCVEANFADGTTIAIDCTAVENQLEVNTVQQSELDWLIYNEPRTYVNLILSGSMATYLKEKAIHKQQD